MQGRAQGGPGHGHSTARRHQGVGWGVNLRRNCFVTGKNKAAPGGVFLVDSVPIFWARNGGRQHQLQYFGGMFFAED